MPIRPAKPTGKKGTKQIRNKPIVPRDAYIKACAEFGLHPNSGVLDILTLHSGPSTVEYIDVSRNYVGDKGLLPLLHVIDRCPNLQEINLSENGLRNNAIRALCNCAVKHPSLQSINISDNYISEGAAIELQRLLEDNPRICWLGIDNTKIDVEWRIRLRDLVNANASAAMIQSNVMLSPKKLTLNKPITTAHKEIFDFLLKVNKERSIHATLRVAGGWVRDVLLGLHSQDIDIAIESPVNKHISGETFAREVSSYQKEIGLTARTVSVIRVNPELSKHIETATVCVYNTPIEFCALRYDEYTKSDSRIPLVRPATPLEDALRRDFTINALFYNLHTGEIEDYSTGLEDLQTRILRCPLNPKETFSDDPLRLLRGIRFIGQLGELNFTLDESVISCVDKELLEKMILKVSRERIGKEIDKMLSGNCPEKCMELLFKTNILQNVLLVELYMKSSKKGHITADIDHMEYLISNDNANNNLETLLMLNRTIVPLFSKNESPLYLSLSSDKIVAVLFIIFLPFYRSVPRKQLSDRLYALCLNGLKLPLNSFNNLRRMMECYNTFLEYNLDLHCISDTNKIPREVKLSLFEGLCDLNDKKIIPTALKIVLSSYLLLEHRKDILNSHNVENAIQVINQMWSIIEKEPGLIDAMTRQLPIKGNELSKLIPLEPIEIGSNLLALRRYAMLNSNATREEMILWLRNEKERTKIN